MDAAGNRTALLRIERGQASDEELAALAVTLLSLAAGRPPGGPGTGTARRPADAWRPPEHARAYRAPHSWR
ncbi:acyl-CoA carboxylase epsilon subunit [Streptomyces atriruber]|uniref:acyl-CoA carboxylase epsilon subunit n=1 Tax=Streptomyces atriruber TaxID=545121 RepID=UPI0006E26D2E|nr:acyl-CoA carboxylase epsilon subunit [Streptomyces atriruber]